MQDKKRWCHDYKKIVVRCLILIAVLLCILGRIFPEKGVDDYIETDDIEEIVIKKVLEDGNGIEECCIFPLEKEDINEFYTILSEMNVTNLKTQPFSISKNIRYYVYLNDANGFSKGTMKFYGDEVLIFDYVYGDCPSIHKRYSITSSSIKYFFEARISQEKET